MTIKYAQLSFIKVARRIMQLATPARAPMTAQEMEAAAAAVARTAAPVALRPSVIRPT